MKNYKFILPGITVLFSLILFHTCQSQHNLLTFGRVKEYKSIEKPIGLLRGDFNGDRIDDIAVYSESKIRFYYQKSDTLGFSYSTSMINKPVNRIVSSRVNNDAYEDFISIGGKPLRIHSYIGKRRRIPFLIWSGNVQESFNEMLVADLDNDKNMDIVLFGKKELGLVVLRGKGNGTFRPPQKLLPDYSFSDMVITDVNDDGINDIIGVGWIENVISVFTGYGNFTFSEPARLPLTGEIGFLKIGDINGDDNTDLLVYVPNEDKCMTFRGDGLGGFKEHQIIRLSGKIVEGEIADVTNDSREDVLLLSREEELLGVYMQNDNGFLADKVPFSAVTKPPGFIMFTDKNPKLKNAAILDTANEMIKIFYNARVKPDRSKIREYALGSTPMAIRAVDLNNNGWMDIVVANNRSQTYSFFLNDKKGYYNGQWVIPLAFSPGSFYLYDTHKEYAFLFSVSSPGAGIDMVEVDLSRFTCYHTKINTQSIPEIISVLADKETKEFSVLTRESVIENEETKLAEFKVKRGGRYSEKVINFGDVSGYIDVSGVINMKGGKRQIWCTTFDDSAKLEGLYVVVADTNWDVLGTKLHSVYHSDVYTRRVLVSSDFNNDDRPDCAVYREDSVGRIFIYLGNDNIEPDSSADYVIDDVEISSSGDLKLTDIDRNRQIDIVVNNRMRKSLDVYFGFGDGMFSRPVNLASTARWGGFDISDIDKDNRMEILMTDSLKGIMSIFPLEDW